MKSFCVGFMFDDPIRNLVLIQKNRPPDQVGLLNGVGGKIEPYDKTPFDAMVREFYEETGVLTNNEDWKCFNTLLIPADCDIYYFSCFNTQYLHGVRQTTDELIKVISVDSLSRWNTNPNTKWLIPMALSFRHGELARSFTTYVKR